MGGAEKPKKTGLAGWVIAVSTVIIILCNWHPLCFTCGCGRLCEVLERHLGHGVDPHQSLLCLNVPVNHVPEILGMLGDVLVCGLTSDHSLRRQGDGRL